MGRDKKRKQASEDEDDVNHSASESSDTQPQQAIKPKQSTSSAKGKESHERKTVKKPKIGESSPTREEGKIQVLKNAQGEKYVDLGKKRRASVRSFKGQVYVDIREFYSTDGDDKPGKKGISLTMDQWETLKRSMGLIDSLFAEHSGKK